MKETLEKVKQYINDAWTTYAPDVKREELYDNGAIYYMNGNDGTNFDWDWNDRTCEFFIFYKETEMGFIKCWANKDGDLEGYLYKDLGKSEAIKLPAREIGPRTAKKFKEELNIVCDEREEYDEVIDWNEA